MLSRLFVDVGIEIILGNFAFGREPDIFETFRVADAFFEHANDVRSPADVRMHEAVDKLWRSRLAFRIETVERSLEAVKIKARGIFRVEKQREIISVIEPGHDHQRLAVNQPVLRYVRAGQIAGPINSLLDEMFEGVFVNPMTRADPTDRTLASDRGNSVQSPFDESSFLLPVKRNHRSVVDPAVTDDLMTGCMQLLESAGKNLCNTAVGIDRALYVVTVESIQDAPDARFTSVLAVSERCIVGFVPFMAPILGRFIERFEGDKEADHDLGVVGPFQGCWTHELSFRCTEDGRWRCGILGAVKVTENSLPTSCMDTW